ncbi:hypothetical protein ASF98_05290 [Arthrobacter sp. Leaf337]|uniref:hypothetical protein n=1 Tax=Arthrobacter sp. Leaf337 TaxID=1736342 RepID=UPI0006FAA6EC|nr:hypothetical protein [Arthrobacter sp. Leaf337]KQR75255.1 hypothetical protein ASF98_05290 [Arthrobacter sp. Leaf337]
MKRIALLRERVATAGATGTHCPASGLWAPVDAPHDGQTFFEGHFFPSYNGSPTVWRRVTAGDTSR